MLLVDKVHLLNFDRHSPLFFDYDIVVSEIFKSKFGHPQFLYPIFLFDGSCEIFDAGISVCFGNVLVFLRMRSTTHTIPL